MKSKEAEFPDAEQVREIERVVLLKVIDNKWMSHIDDMDQLREESAYRHTAAVTRSLSTR